MNSKPILSNAWYDRLKFVALVVLPGLGTLYFAIAQIWGLPKAEEVVGTVTAVVTFLGLLIKFSDARYNNSDEKYDANIIKTQRADGQLVYALEFETREQQERANNKNELLVKLI